MHFKHEIIIIAIILSWCGASYCYNRFSVDDSGIITDSYTGLQWLVGPNEPYFFDSATQWIEELGEGWELPNRVQLLGLFSAGFSYESWGIFSAKRFSGFWVWTGEPSGPSAMYAVDFNDGSVISQNTEFPNAFRYGRAFAVRTDSERYSSEGNLITDSYTGNQWLICDRWMVNENQVRDWVKELGSGWRLPSFEELEALFASGIESGDMGPFSGSFVPNDGEYTTWYENDSCDYLSVFEFRYGEEWIAGSMGYSSLAIVPFAVHD